MELSSDHQQRVFPDKSALAANESSTGSLGAEARKVAARKTKVRMDASGVME
jgi:hypothetical protein